MTADTQNRSPILIFMTTTNDITEEHLDQIAAAIAEAKQENGSVVITFGVKKRFVKVRQWVGHSKWHQTIREFEQYLA